MGNKKHAIAPFFEYSLILAIFILLVIYTNEFFFVVPYAGFTFNPSNGSIEDVFVVGSGEPLLQPGDRLIRIGSLTFEQYRQDLSHSFFEGTQPGDVVDLVIQREGETLSIPWRMPGRTNLEFSARLNSQWWIAFIFWFFGTLSVLLIRPKNDRWLLLVVFNYLISIWLIAGLNSSFRTLGSPYVLRIATWFCVPVFWQFHHRAITQWENREGRSWWGIAYLAAAGLAVCEIFRIMPMGTYYLGFILAVVGSPIILSLHAWRRPNQRREIGLLGFTYGLILSPIILTSIMGALNQFFPISLASFFVLPALPGSYFYIIYRRQLGSMELHANRIAIFYIYGLLLFTTLLIIAPLVNVLLPSKGFTSLILIITGLLAGLISILVYPYFEGWAERRLLGMPLPPQQLLAAFAIRITTSLDIDRLIHLLRNQALPTLLIRQAALMRLEENGALSLVFLLGLNPNQLPAQTDIPVLLAMVDKGREQVIEMGANSPLQWIRIVLDLTVENNRIGLLLIGRRDPDDYYLPTEILTLQALANQTALALINIEQAKNLSALYQDDLKRQEAESNRLAHELHDEVLGLLTMGMMNADRSDFTYFDQAYKTAVKRIRAIIEGLRPALLNYGLYTGLQHLTGELQSLAENQVEIDFAIPSSQARYPNQVEFHLYRIVQQACNNVLQHANARHLAITGSLEEDGVELVVSDDGIGFEIPGLLDLSALLAKKHFGLAGMYERADLIHARIQINSNINQGTRVSITWRAH
jgi:signal transduction histidine kinase